MAMCWKMRQGHPTEAPAAADGRQSAQQPQQIAEQQGMPAGGQKGELVVHGVACSGLWQRAGVTARTWKSVTEGCGLAWSSDCMRHRNSAAGSSLVLLCSAVRLSSTPTTSCTQLGSLSSISVLIQAPSPHPKSTTLRHACSFTTCMHHTV